MFCPPSPPAVKNVPTYTRDYLPTFKIPDTYIRVSTAAQAQVREGQWLWFGVLARVAHILEEHRSQ